MNLRCSSLPLALICGASQRPPKLVIESRSDASDLGTRVHAALARYIGHGASEFVDLPEDERWLARAGARMFSVHRDSFPGPLAEHPLIADCVTPEGTEFVFRGTCDVYSKRAGVVRIWDHKTGFKDSDYSGQALGYCALALLLDTEVTEATCTLGWLRTGEIENYTMRRADLPAFMARLYEMIDWNGVYTTGPHCEGCKRRHECEAWTAMARSDLAAFEEGEAEQISLRDNGVFLIQRIGAISKLLDRMREHIKYNVITFGDIEGETHRLTIEVTEKRHLDTLKALDVLNEHVNLPANVLAPHVKISLSGVEDEVAKAAGKGKGAKAIRDLREKLEAAEAIKLIPEHRLVTRRK